MYVYFFLFQIKRFEEIDSLCEKCLEQVSVAYKLISQLNKSEKILRDNSKDFNLQEIKAEALGRSQMPKVELITAQGKFNLEDLIIVEDEEDANSNEGALGNLGSEITAEILLDSQCFQSDENDKTATFIENDLNCINDEEDIFKCEEKRLDAPQDDEKFVNSWENKEESCSISKDEDEEIKGQSDSFLCQLCGFICTSKQVLRRHMSYRHNEKKYVCELCNKVYNSSTSLRYHKAVHENKRKFLCTICGKGFNASTALKYHMRVHNNEMKYQCYFCGKSFRMVHSFNRHIRIHTGVRPYECKYCDKAFRSSGELKCHQWIHTGYRPYHCKYCNKGFTKTYNMKVHMFGHDGPHKCDICKRGFLEVKYLNSHMKLRHKIIVE